ncbi:uncharacterized protein LAESUDRAFT_764378 [Laetiporus sulphureus 93-53]|uniref:DUF6533 domain-containing protein n=1 Tax=Laetiporus sulphureus 93-53 TaxID=1314785 RepID=A0A165BC03_9APHY|nr:uncharacterized protein LAESUDRAFT_764378 [Laetiporus sulphureus 93-53]KZT00706.1 hypothetical protein LAESUDRAFT_764378 [Laetiporus sulphureus 93-53]
MLLYGRDVSEVLSPDEVPDQVQGNQTGIYVSVVLATLVSYDAICTFDKEVRYFWNGCTLGMTKTVFFLVCASTSNSPEKSSHHALLIGNVSQWGKDFSYWVTIIAIDYILMIRVLALYHNGLSPLMFLRNFPKFGLLGLTPSITSCSYFAPGNEDTYILDWTIPLAYEALLLALALYKATKFWKSNGLHGSRLVWVLIKDQAVYFALAISCSVLYIVDDIVLMSPTLTSVIQAMGSPTLLCILGSRMFFNLKEAAGHGINVGTNWSSYSHGTDDVFHFESVFDDPQIGEGALAPSVFTIQGTGTSSLKPMPE